MEGHLPGEELGDGLRRRVVELADRRHVRSERLI
jgi:hypothetical protein